MTRLLACALVALAVAGSAQAATVRQTFRSGLAAVQTGDYHVRARAARLTLIRLRHEPPSGARSLAIGGFLWALWGLRAQIEFVDEDSGQVAEATIDSARADRCWMHAAARLRAAGQALGVPVGLVNGF